MGAGVLALSLLLLWGQVAGLSHSHGDDLRQQYDCEICTNFGGNEDVALSDGHVLPPPLVLPFDAGQAMSFVPPSFFSFLARAPPAG